jgi:hypothetical protein
MCFGSAPRPPDPVATAQAQSGINRADLGYAAGLNQINQTGPFGSVSYSGEIGSPNRTQTTTLTPEMQAILNGQTQLTGGLTDLANQRLAGAPRSNFTLDGQPDVRRAQGVTFGTSFNQGPAVQNTFDQGPALRNEFDQGQAVQTSFNNGGALQRGFDNGGALQRDIQAGAITDRFDAGGQAQRSVDLSGQPALNTDFSKLSQQAQEAAYRQNTKYLDPQFAQQEQATRARLAAQGVTEGSQAYNQEMANLAQQRDQSYSGARDQAINQGFNLEGQMFGQNLAARQQGVGEQFQLGEFGNSSLAQQFGMNQAQAQFQNQAQNQGFGQNQARAQLNNDAAMMDYQRNLGMAEFGNNAAMQDYARNQGMAQFGNQAAGQQYSQNRGSAEFANTAANQQYDRNRATAQFGNDAASQQYGQNLGAAQFGNDALAQQFNAGLNLQQADQSNRSQSINENILGRNQNINEAMAFVNGAPVSPQNPTFQPFAQSTAAQAAPDAIGLASANYGNQSAARAQILGSIFGSAGKIGGAAIGASCWVAREVYGVENPKWVIFREWMLNKSPKWFRALYLTYGERFAAWIKDKPKLKTMIRNWMDARIVHAS